MKGGKSIQIEGIGTALDQTIGPTDPGPVRVELLLGKRRYRMEFGGNVVFKPGQQFLATGAPAPTTSAVAADDVAVAAADRPRLNPRGASPRPTPGGRRSGGL